jgi:ribosomal protein L7Ae-like RNA K-turn-binding protein
MIRYFFLCLLSFATSIACFSQAKFNPTGIVLCPFEKIVAKDLQDSINTYQSATEITEDIRKQFIPPGLQMNWKLVREKELAIMANQNYFSLLSLSLEREINYKLVENYTNSLIVVAKDSSKTDLVTYKKLIEQHKVDWIVNPSSIKISQAAGKIKMEVKFQAYYHPLGYILLNTAFAITEADAKDCNDSKLTCLLNAAAAKMASLTVDKIERVR